MPLCRTTVSMTCGAAMVMLSVAVAVAHALPQQNDDSQMEQQAAGLSFAADVDPPMMSSVTFAAAIRDAILKGGTRGDFNVIVDSVELVQSGGTAEEKTSTASEPLLLRRSVNDRVPAAPDSGAMGLTARLTFHVEANSAFTRMAVNVATDRLCPAPADFDVGRRPVLPSGIRRCQRTGEVVLATTSGASSGGGDDRAMSAQQGGGGEAAVAEALPHAAWQRLVRAAVGRRAASGGVDDDAAAAPSGVIDHDRHTIPYWDNIRFTGVFHGQPSCEAFGEWITNWIKSGASVGLYGGVEITPYNPASLVRSWTFNGRAKNATLLAHTFNLLSDYELMHRFGIEQLSGVALLPTLPSGLPYGRDLKFLYTFANASVMGDLETNLPGLLRVKPNQVDVIIAHTDKETLTTEFWFHGPDSIELSNILATVPTDPLANVLGVIDHRIVPFPAPKAPEGSDKKLIFVLVGVAVVVLAVGIVIVYTMNKGGGMPCRRCCVCCHSGDEGDVLGGSDYFYDSASMRTANGGGGGRDLTGRGDAEAYRRLN